MQEAGFFQKAAHLRSVVRAELLTVLNGQLEGRAFQVRQQDLQIVGVEVGVFGRAAEEVIGVLDDVLVEGCAGGHQHGGRSALAAAGAPGALPRGGDGARIASHHYGIQGADVDAQLQRVGGHYRADFAIAQLALDFAALAREVAAAIAAHGVLRQRTALQSVL